MDESNGSILLIAEAEWQVSILPYALGVGNFTKQNLKTKKFYHIIDFLLH